MVVFLSVMLGDHIFSRLQDFNYTKNKLRKLNIYNYSGHVFCGVAQELKLLKILDSFKIFFSGVPPISLDDCKNYNGLEDKNRDIDKAFLKLGEIAHNLGTFTWLNVVGQTAFFALGVLFFIISKCA